MIRFLEAAIQFVNLLRRTKYVCEKQIIASFDVQAILVSVTDVIL